MMIEVIPCALSWRIRSSRWARVLVVQGRGRLVEDEQLHSLGQRLGDLDELLLADPDVDDLGVRAARPGRPCASSCAASLVGLVPVDDTAGLPLVAEEDVLGDRQVRAQRELLVDDDDSALLGVTDALETARLALEDDVARRSVPCGYTPLSTFIRVDFPAPFSPQIGVDLTARHGHRDVLQRLDAGEGLGDPSHFEDRGHGRRTSARCL